MKLTNFLVFKAVVALAFGVGLAVVPVELMALYGMMLDPAGAMMARMVGALLIGVGLICWLDRSAEHRTLQNIILALCIGDTVGFLAVLVSQLAGLMNALGWIIVALWFVLAVGLGYFRFRKPDAS